MKYADALAKMIANSGKTLREVAELCGQLGVKIDPSYLSRLQTGKQTPASDKVNAAIATVCKKEPKDLLLAAYSDKAPDFIQRFVATIAKYLRALAENILYVNYPEALANKKKRVLIEMDDWKLIDHIINQPEYSIRAATTAAASDQKLNETTYQYTMPDQSLKDIPKGSILEISRTVDLEEVRMGDYVLITLADSSHRVRRFMRHDDKVILLADNLSHQSYTLSNKITIIGKVLSVWSRPG